MVTREQKNNFVKWFLNNYQLKNRECVWILNYIMSHNLLMDKVHFVEEAKYTKKGMLMSTTCAKDYKPFLFFIDNNVLNDAEKAFHNVRLNRNEDIYIQLEFKNKQSCPEYWDVIETENVYIEGFDINETVRGMDLIGAKALIQEMEKRNKLKLIDNALDNKDEELFNSLIKSL